MAGIEADDWPPPGACWFCERSRGDGAHWTCAGHRAWEHYAQLVAFEFHKTQPQPASYDDEGATSAIMDWIGSGGGDQVEKRLSGLTNDEFLSQGDALAVRMMLLSLIAKKVEEAADHALPDVNALKLDPNERERTLRQYLELVAQHTESRQLSLHLDDLRGDRALYTIKRRGIFGRSESNVLHISDFGKVTVGQR